MIMEVRSLGELADGFLQLGRCGGDDVIVGGNSIIGRCAARVGLFVGAVGANGGNAAAMQDQDTEADEQEQFAGGGGETFFHVFLLVLGRLFCDGS